jgi:cell division protein FtsN
MKDYASQHQSSQSKRRPSRHKIIIILISLIVISSIITISSKKKTRLQPRITKTKVIIKNQPKNHNKNKAASRKKPAPTNSTPKLDFYTMLANASVKTPKLKPTITANHTTLTTNGTYQLQAAASTQLNAIKQLHQQLEELGYSAYITQFNNNDTTWYRLQIGPFSSQNSAKINQGTLSKLNFPTIIQKINNH